MDLIALAKVLCQVVGGGQSALTRRPGRRVRGDDENGDCCRAPPRGRLDYFFAQVAV